MSKPIPPGWLWIKEWFTARGSKPGHWIKVVTRERGEDKAGVKAQLESELDFQNSQIIAHTSVTRALRLDGQLALVSLASSRPVGDSMSQKQTWPVPEETQQRVFFNLHTDG